MGKLDLGDSMKRAISKQTKVLIPLLLIVSLLGILFMPGGISISSKGYVSIQSNMAMAQEPEVVTGQVVGPVERQPLIYNETEDYLFVDLNIFQIRFHKGTAGYNEIWNDGQLVVAEVDWIILNGKNKQVGEPQSIEWAEID